MMTGLELPNHMRYYRGDPGQELASFVATFTKRYRNYMFTQRQPAPVDPYTDRLRLAQHKCETFCTWCEGRAQQIAENLLEHLMERFLQAPEGAHDLTPGEVKELPVAKMFELFILSIKASLGPSDPLIHWLLLSKEVILTELTTAGFDSFLTKLTNYLSRLLRAHGDAAETLKNAAVTGGGLGAESYLDPSSPMGEGYAVNAITRGSFNPLDRTTNDSRISDLMDSAHAMQRRDENAERRRRPTPVDFPILASGARPVFTSRTRPIMESGSRARAASLRTPFDRAGPTRAHAPHAPDAVATAQAQRIAFLERNCFASASRSRASRCSSLSALRFSRFHGGLR